LKFYLIAVNGKKKGTPVPIRADLFVIGTAPVCQLRSKSPAVGQQHCALIRRENKAFVRDLDSGLPTLVNGKEMPPSEEWPLHGKDHLKVGPLEFVVRFFDGTLSRQDLEEWGLKSLDVLAAKEEEDDPNKSPDFQQPSTPALAAAAILANLQSQRGVLRGRLRVGLEAGITTLAFTDVYLVEEAELARIKNELFENANRHNLRVLLDFKNVRRMSSLAVQMVEEYVQYLRPWGSALALCRVDAEILKNLKKVGLTDRVPYFADKPTALREPW
jgi:pSer/pThr/pTyr-binding forkhead associated (FHA) protein/anti-anti-sigma regulatory factor